MPARAATLRQRMFDERLRAREYTRAHGEDLPEIRDWSWPGADGARATEYLSAAAATGGDNE